MDFYKSLHVQEVMFNVALMPFKGTDIVRYTAHGMCYPGLGLQRYIKMGSALLMILNQILPKDFRIVMELLKRTHKQWVRSNLVTYKEALLIF